MPEPSLQECLRAALADRYTIEREIGSGGMATVYLAEDLKHKRQVAVKVLDPDLAESLGAERFLREIETAANLTHPHILPIHDSGEADGFLYYVMPYARGESLRSRLTKERQLPVEDAIQITREIADALAYAHREGVIHRDVKPANIMLEEGHAVLADFGVAQAVAEAKDARLTRTGTSLGTPSYMSPEQATGERDLDGRTDQYALGCVLYEMLTGYPPFTGAQVEAVVRQHLTVQPPSVTEARPPVPAEVEKVINRALSKSPADRFKTTGEMAAALALTAAPVVVRRVWSGRRAVIFGVPVILGVGAIAALASLLPWVGADLPSGKVAVLSLTTLSEQEEDAHFAAGLHNQILTQLQKIGSLDVISSTSVQEYRDSPKNLRTIGQELGAKYIGEGTVWRAGDSVRIDFQLIDAETDTHVWSENYEREVSLSGAVFSVTTEIAQSVALSLRAAITPEQTGVLQGQETDNPEAYDLYVKGLGHLEAGTSGSDGEKSHREAVDLFQEAVRLDPGFGLAHAKLAYAHLLLFWSGFDRTEARVELARQALDQALRLGPDLGETHFGLGLFRYHVEVDYEGARESFEAARQRLPGDSDPDVYIGYILRRQGRFLESAAIQEEAFTLNPRDASLAGNLSATYGALRKNEEAARWAERAIDLGTGAYRTATRAYLKQGEIDEARAVLSGSPDSTSGGMILAGFWVEVYARDFDAAASWLDRAPGPILQLSGPRHPVALDKARLHRWAGRPELAQEAFREAVTVLRAQRQVFGNPESAIVYAGFGEGESELAIAYAGLGERDAALARIDSVIDAYRTFPDLYVAPIPFNEMAVVQVLLGENEVAIGILEELMEMEYFPALTVYDLSLDPTWDPLRSHPRFQALLEKYRDDVAH